MESCHGEVMPRLEKDMYCYCIYCEASKCAHIAETLPLIIPCRSIYPMKIQHTWADGCEVDIKHPLLPGYVFVFMENKPKEYRTIKSACPGIFSLLSYGGDSYELRDSDEKFAMMLLEKDGLIGKTSVYYVGDIMKIREGSFTGMDAKILKVDKRRKLIKVEIEFTGKRISTWLEFEEV